MSNKDEIQRSLTELVKLSADLPAGPGKEMVAEAISDAANSIEVLLTPEGLINANALVASGKAFARRRSEPTNGTSWCC
jgi:hypothetical protein